MKKSKVWYDIHAKVLNCKFSNIIFLAFYHLSHSISVVKVEIRTTKCNTFFSYFNTVWKAVSTDRLHFTQLNTCTALRSGEVVVWLRPLLSDSTPSLVAMETRRWQHPASSVLCLHPHTSQRCCRAYASLWPIRYTLHDGVCAPHGLCCSVLQSR